jgi:signal transduction histidine kinase
MKNDFSRKNVSVIHERMSESVTVLLDKRILELTLRQLVTNALMYSHDNSAVTIQTSFHLPGSLVGGMEVPEESIVVAVLDKGAGIPDKDKDKIFTKMFRASNAEQAGGTGSGLGLYIVKTIMNLPYVAGDVWFSSEEGKGSTFYLAIPTKGMQKKEGRTVLE